MNRFTHEFFIPYPYSQENFRIRVQMDRPHRKSRPSYLAQLEMEIDGVFKAVARCDDWHDKPHIDRCHPNGTVTKQWLDDTGDNLKNMGNGITLLMRIAPVEIARFNNEYNKLQPGRDRGNSR
ncbi:DUF7718 family protein [Baaleninema simplex]|uniref:DUF7718 family protein n=1 Tax=Baaleninema simplex TaxID=2862350 RepID=UPI004054A984